MTLVNETSETINPDNQPKSNQNILLLYTELNKEQNEDKRLESNK